MKKALIFQGGWDGHEPQLTSKRFAGMLERNGISAEIYDNHECFADLDNLLTYDLIVACWTMGTMEGQYSRNISEAVARGVGLAGCHGGMCDAFRNDTEWQFMTGGQWVSHPGGDGVEYTVNIRHGSSPIVEGLQDFTVKSEHYYLHIDPAVEVLATTLFPLVNYYHASSSLWICPWPGRSSGAWAACSTTLSGTTMTCLRILPTPPSSWKEALSGRQEGRSTTKSTA